MSRIPVQTSGHIGPTGLVVRKCQFPGTAAFSFDDGPWFYTTYLLDELARHNARATFFLNVWPNLNKNTRPEFWGPIVRRVYQEGHLIGLHGWAHDSLDSLTEADRMASMSNTTDFFAQSDFLNGTRPRYMRPPFGDCKRETGCLQQFTKAGYRVVFWDFDSDDWRHDSGEESRLTEQNLMKKLNESSPESDSMLILMHDNRLQTAINMGSFFQKFIEKGFRLVTVGECIGDPRENWYWNETEEIPYEHPSRLGDPMTYGSASTSIDGHMMEAMTVALLIVIVLMSLIWVVRKYTRLQVQLSNRTARMK